MRLNPHPRQSPLARRELSAICSLARECFRRGWTAGTAGNFSFRDQKGVVWQSPSGVVKGDLEPGMFVPVDPGTGLPFLAGVHKPSDETPLHVGIYRQLDARSVFHVHTPAIVHRSLQKNSFVFSGHEMQKALGSTSHADELEVPVIENTQNMRELEKTCGRMIRPKVPALILAGHGVYAWGATPEKAFSYIEGLEFLCQTQ